MSIKKRKMAEYNVHILLKVWRITCPCLDKKWMTYMSIKKRKMAEYNVHILLKVWHITCP